MGGGEVFSPQLCMAGIRRKEFISRVPMGKQAQCNKEVRLVLGSVNGLLKLARVLQRL